MIISRSGAVPVRSATARKETLCACSNKMASNDEEDAVVGEETVATRRTRSGRPVATARKGRGRKKVSSPRSGRSTRNTRAKQQVDDEDEDEEIEEILPEGDTTEQSQEVENNSPVCQDEAASLSDTGGDKVQDMAEPDTGGDKVQDMAEELSKVSQERKEDSDHVSTNGVAEIQVEAVVTSSEASQEVVLDSEANKDNISGDGVQGSEREVPELEESPPPSVLSSVVPTIQSNLRQSSMDDQSQESLPGFNQLKEAVEELNGLVQPPGKEQETVLEVSPEPVEVKEDHEETDSQAVVEVEPMEVDLPATSKKESMETTVIATEPTETDSNAEVTDTGTSVEESAKDPDMSVDTEVTSITKQEERTGEPDTEMVSEDELPTETKLPLETEAVSDEELPEPAAPKTEDLPETEEVSEDELPPEKSYKKKSKSKQKSQEKTASSDTGGSSSSSKKKKKSRESQKRKILVGDSYDPSSPTSENSMDAPPSAKKAAISADGDDGPKSSSKSQEKQRKSLPELDKYWKAVKEDPSDFTGWTYLLQYVDQESDIDAAREAYDAFLSHYPYCYGYWRKYADYEKRKGNKEKCEEVFERGLKAIPLSVDLWIHYLNHCKSVSADNEELLREQFEKAIEACGLEFRSDRLWESYIKWEAEGKRYQKVTAIYDRLLATPTQSYISHFESFTALVNAHTPQKLLSVDEFLTERREVLQQLKQYEQPKAPVDPAGPPGEEGDAPPGEEGDEKTQQRNDEETTALRERIIATRRKIHKATAAAVSDRWVYEEAIKRPYFHVKPLERCQLKNWREYLDYEVSQGDRTRIVVLFERCLIACALYEDLWLKFIRYLENLKEDQLTEKIRDVYERACTIHHTKKPNLHLYWAVFEEAHQNYDKASEILVNLEKIIPNLMQVAYRRINLERRRGRLDHVGSLYEHYITTAKNKVTANNMAIKYARFNLKVKGNIDEAISVLKTAIEKDKDNPRLFLQLIDVSLQRTPLNEAEVVAAIDKYLENKDADIEQKVMFAQRKVEFLEDFGESVLSVQKAQDEFARYCKQAKDKKKKMAEEAKGESKKSKASASGDASSTSAPTSASPAPAAAPPQYPPSQYPTGYSGAPAPPYQGQYPPAGQQPPYQYNQQYNQSDPNYANYQNWGYSQTGYSGYNQSWTGNYNYY